MSAKELETVPPKVNSPVVGAAVFAFLVALVEATPAVGQYSPPIGIPAPSFGIDEVHTMYAGQYYAAGGFTYKDAGNGPYTHYVDNTDPNATNTDNPYGTPDRPRADIFDGSVLTLPPGSVVEIHGGPYTYSGWRRITSQGTAENPVFVRAVDPDDKVQINGSTGHDLRMEGTYLIVENLEFYHDAYPRVWEGAHHIGVRRCEVHDPVGQWLAGGTALYAGTYTNDVVFYQNHIHDKLKGTPSDPGDCHGVNIGSASYNIWVLENHIHDNSGDAFQAAHRASPAPHHVYVGRNVMHDDRENGVDLKTIHDVVVSENVMYGYAFSSTSIGDAIVVGSNGVTPGQYGPIRAWLLFNDVRDSYTGIRVEGANDCWILGNRIHDTYANGIQLDIDPDSSNINIVGNTIAFVGGDGLHHSWQTGATEFHIEDNIFSNVGGDHIQLAQAIAQEADLTNNLFWQGGENVSVRWGSTSYVGQSASGINALPDSSGNVVGDPAFTDAVGRDFSLQQTSAAIDVGSESPAYAAFTSLYGRDIAKDTDGVVRPQAGGWDIGAYEWVPGVQVVGRYVFYNNSAFDGNDPAANAADDDAIATDKQALLPGQTAGFANYTSYSRGINGVMLDITNPPGAPTPADFEVRVGNDSNPAAWPGGPAPAVSVRPGEGGDGAHRLTLTWPDNAIEKQWLEVTVLANGTTGLLEPDVFYFGNAIGETGNSPTDAKVTSTDEAAVRDHPHTLVNNPADITCPYDFDRDRKVGPTDAILCRNNGTNSMSALQLIAPVPNEARTVDAGSDTTITLPANSTAPDGTVSDGGYAIPPGAVTATWSKLGGPGGTSGMGWKNGILRLLDDTRTGLGLYFVLDQDGPGGLCCYETSDHGATFTGMGDFAEPGDPKGNEKKHVQWIYDRVGDQIECVYEGVSKEAVSVGREFRDFTQVGVYIMRPYTGTWGQLDVDGIRIADTPSGG